MRNYPQRQGTIAAVAHMSGNAPKGVLWRRPMRALLLFLVGVPLPLVLLLAFCTDIV